MVILFSQSQHNAAIFAKNCLLPLGFPLLGSQTWRNSGPAVPRRDLSWFPFLHIQEELWTIPSDLNNP